MDSQHVSPGIQPCACSLQASPLKPLRALPAHQKTYCFPTKALYQKFIAPGYQVVKIMANKSGDFMMNHGVTNIPSLDIEKDGMVNHSTTVKTNLWNWKISVVFDPFFLIITLMTSSFFNSNQLVVSLVQPELLDYEMVTKSSQWWIGGECWWAYSRHLPSMVLQSFDQKFPNSLLFRVNRKSCHKP